MNRRARIVIGLLALTTLVLSGCQKPPPAITFWTGTTSTSEPALCWAFESDNLQPTECAQEIIAGRQTDGLTLLEPVAGNTVGISVATEVAAAGWTPALGGQKLTQSPLTTTYFRFTFPLGVPETGIPLQVIAGQDTKTKGIWSVLLLPQSA